MTTTMLRLPDRRASRLMELNSWHDKCNTALFRAIAAGRRRTVEALLNAGARLAGRDLRGHTVLIAALHLDRSQRRLGIVRVLLVHGANPVDCDETLCRDALGWAVSLARVSECRLILADCLGDVDMIRQDATGKTVLHLAVETGNVEIVQMLMKAFTKYGISVDVYDGLGLTPLMHAQRLAFHDVVKILTDDGGACPFQCDLVKNMNSMEWYREGILERLSNTEQELLENDKRNRILGRVVRPLIVPRIKISQTDKSSEMSNYRDNKYYVSMESLASDSSYFVNDLSSYRSLTIPSVLYGGQGPKTIRSLIDMSSERGVIPTQFHASRSRGVRDDGWRMSTSEILGIVADQNTPSFRMPFRKIIPAVIPNQKTNTEKQKVSTLAIIMGKERKRSTKNKPNGNKLKVPTDTGRKRTPERRKVQKATA